MTDGSNASSTATVTVTITGGERCAGCGRTCRRLRPSTGLRCRWRRPTPIPTWATATALRSTPTGTKGKVTDLGNGVFSYDPNGAFASLKAGATATDTFTYTVTDGSNASSTATVTVTITGQNDAPVAADVSATALEHGPAVQVAASYTDPDVGDSHTFAIDTTGTKGKVADLGNGIFSYDPNGAFASLKVGATATDTLHLHGDGRIECVLDRDGDRDHHRRERRAGCGQCRRPRPPSTGRRCRSRRRTRTPTWATATASRSARRAPRAR